MATTPVPPRDAIAREHRWNDEALFEGIAAWEQAFEAVSGALDALEPLAAGITESPQGLADWMEHLNALVERLGRLAVYAYVGHTVDHHDQAAKALYDRVGALYARFGSVAAPTRPAILEIGRERIDRWLAEEPRLRPFTHSFDDVLRRADHVRSAEVEALLGRLGEPLNTVETTADLLVDGDLRFEPATDASGDRVEIAQGNIDALLQSADRTLRRSAWENYHDGYRSVAHALANNQVAAFKQQAFLARARHYESTLAASLDESNLPAEVYHALIETFRRHLPLWHRYWALRRRALGLEALHLFDVKAPLTGAAPTIPYGEGVELLCRGLAPMGDEYVEIARRGMTSERWIDIYPNRGKRSGAFSSGSVGTLPYIVMSYLDDLDSLSTLAHEMGHSMHTYFAGQHQIALHGGYSMFVAEVASNFHQALLRRHLLETVEEPAVEIAILEEAMANFHRYFFMMPTLARLELEMRSRVEQGEPVALEQLSARCVALFSEGFGDEVVLDEPRLGMTWALFTHLYLPYYVYQYATGIAAAHALAERVIEEGAPAAERYIGMLSAGGARYPLDALDEAGVDMRSPAPVERAFATLERYVDRLEQLVEKGAP